MTTFLVMGILISLALPLLSMVDTQQAGTAHERKAEGSFNVSEAALNAMVFTLSSGWPASSENAFPVSCTQETTEPKCPYASALKRTYRGEDFPAVSWTVQVRDDDGTEYYDPQRIDDPPITWDQNGNGKMWVRADGSGTGRSRRIVALVRVHEQVEIFPRHVLTAGWFATTNDGNKVIVDTRGEAAEPATLAVRCTDAKSQSCLGYDPAKRQVTPDTVESGFPAETAVSGAGLDALREKAKSSGTYYPTGCPQSLTGALVFVETADCSYSGGGQFNSRATPGMLVIAHGTLSLGGTVDYYGLVYAANLQRSTGVVVSLTGNALIVGSVAVDGAGGVLAGSSGTNVQFADRVLGEIHSLRAVAIVQGSWRELSGS